MDNLSAKTLKETLWKTLIGLRDGAVDVESATATSSLASSIAKIASVQIKISSHTGRELPAELINFSEVSD